MNSEKPKIVIVEKILSEELRIPNYQRPYRWSKESAATLFNLKRV